MTCAGCGRELTETSDQVPTERGRMHRPCASIARAQARRPSDVCYKHGAELDETGWCPVCRERVVI